MLVYYGFGRDAKSENLVLEVKETLSHRREVTKRESSQKGSLSFLNEVGHKEGFGSHIEIFKLLPVGV